MWEQASHLAASSPPGCSGHALGVSGETGEIGVSVAGDWTYEVQYKVSSR